MLGGTLDSNQRLMCYMEVAIEIGSVAIPDNRVYEVNITVEFAEHECNAVKYDQLGKRGCGHSSYLFFVVMQCRCVFNAVCGRGRRVLWGKYLLITRLSFVGTTLCL